VIAVQTAGDLIYAYGLHAAIDGTANVQLFLDFVIRKQGGRLPGKGAPHAIYKCFEARPLKVEARLFGKLFGKRI
jgi:hypothetical protein